MFKSTERLKGSGTEPNNMKDCFKRAWSADREKERNEELDRMEGIVEDVLDDESVRNITANEIRGSFRLMVLNEYKQHLLCRIENIHDHRKMYCSFVYALNSGIERRIPWDELQIAKTCINGSPWILMGDFNVTLSLSEHIAGKSTIDSDMNEFIDCVNTIEVEDVCKTGMHYTWIKSPSKPHTSIMKKLDRIMANEQFLDEYNQAYVVFHPFLVSDHSPAVIVLPQAMYRKKNSFKFANFVANKEEFSSIVKKGWSNKNGNTFENVGKRRDKLKVAQLVVDNDPFDGDKKEIASQMLSEYNMACSDEDKLLYHMVKIDWLQEGDRNTAYFHKVIKSRRNRNRIVRINNKQGIFVEGDNVVIEFVRHFEEFLGKADNVNPLDNLDNIFTNKLTNEEALYMTREVTDREVKDVMFGINDSKAPGPDRGGRGLRQGDPISPYLFTLVMEVFTLILKHRIIQNPNFKYHDGCKEIKLTHLCFANDLLVMCYGNVDSVMVVKEALDIFSSVSGLKPNMRKSTIFFVNVDVGEKRKLMDIMSFQEGRFPMRYLGAPLINKRLGRNDCKQLIDKVKNRIADWKNIFLSYAGRVQLIASVLGSMQLYWASERNRRLFTLVKREVIDLLEAILEVIKLRLVSLRVTNIQNVMEVAKECDIKFRNVLRKTKP
ncbi:RNA-directed DNA polymerase, eukaryota, reverse transcriptase zinc-binding domain protein [Tanacetum coccineum]